MMFLSINYLLFFLNKMAKMIKINPEKATTGPTVIRRVLKISGLNSVPVVEPVISAKPKTIMAKPMAINIKLIFSKVKRVLFSIKLYCLFFLLSLIFVLLSFLLNKIHIICIHSQISAYRQIR